MRALFAVLIVVAMFLPTAALGDEPSRDQLLDEAIALIGVERLVHSIVDITTRDLYRFEIPEERLSRMTEEELAGYEANVEQQRRFQDAYREILKRDLSTREIEKEVIRPLLDRTYSTAELRELVAFLKSDSGVTTAALLPELTAGWLTHPSGIFRRASVGAVPKAEEAVRTDRQRARWTMADMRSIATATEAWAVDHGRYPAAGSVEELALLLSPTYIKGMSHEDRWGNPFHYSVSEDGMHYRVVSSGSDGQLEWDSDMISRERVTEQRAMLNWEADIIYENGTFIQYPLESRPGGKPKRQKQ
ncbi:MAG: type II secretion system protein GspG [Acidobacteria bacterium]|nr:type II secretion system protein GspG [Acidobacteriota bacterium]